VQRTDSVNMKTSDPKKKTQRKAHLKVLIFKFAMKLPPWQRQSGQSKVQNQKSKIL
jgi:hypothetical protein